MKRRIAILGGALVLLLGLRGSAQGDVTASEKATAETLFDQAVKLMSEDQIAPACEKFEASQRLDPQLGTMLRLADCWDRIDRTASAWALFVEAEAQAAKLGQQERRQMAEERAQDLKQRLSMVVVDVAEPSPNLELRIGGALVPRASWDTPIPVDPGRREVVASAPGYVTWKGSLDVPAGAGETALEVPALTKAPEPPPRVEPAAPVADRGSSGNTQRTLAYVSGGLGVVALASAGVLAYLAYGAKQDSLDYCSTRDANLCSEPGVDERNRARALGNTATALSISGAALLAGGAVLFLTAPTSSAQTGRLAIRPSAASLTIDWSKSW